MAVPTIHEALNAWRAAERNWEATSAQDPAYRSASIGVIAAWLTYQTITEQHRPPSFVLVADDEHRYVAVGDGVKAALGYEPGDLLGRRIEDIAPPDLAATTPDDWQRFLAMGRQDGEFRLLAADGRVVTVRFQARAHYPIPGYHLSRLWPIDASPDPAPVS